MEAYIMHAWILRQDHHPNQALIISHEDNTSEQRGVHGVCFQLNLPKVSTTPRHASTPPKKTSSSNIFAAVYASELQEPRVQLGEKIF
jgi:hypothetical protein